MNEEIKNQIELTLEILKQVLIDNGVSMGLDPDNKAIMFFMTEAYCDTGKFKGITVYIDKLVK